MVEQGIENPRVGGSIPSLATLAVLLVAGCGDRCDRLCGEVTDRLVACRTDALTWQDLGANNANAYRRRCRTDWDATSATLNSRELELALDVCADALDGVPAMSCDEIVSLYATE